MSTENKDRLALRMKPDTKRKIDQWYKAAGCRSKNQFVERAVNFYVDHLAVQDDSGTLPRAVLSSLDGRLGMFEDQLASLIYKHTVELDMMMGILADSYELTEEDMRRRRAESVRNVKNTNGLLPFEQKVRELMRRRTNGPTDFEKPLPQGRQKRGRPRQVHRYAGAGGVGS